MKGLFRKDLLLLKNEKKFLVILVLISVFYSAMGMESFCVFFLAMVAVALVLNSFSKDEFDNGNSFLFTLPFTRKEYVMEKYMLCLGGICGGVLFGSICIFFFRWMKNSAIAGKEILELSAGAVLGFGCVAAVILPVIIKFGVEKGRIPAYLAATLAYVLGFQAAKFVMGYIQELGLLTSQGLGVPILVVGILAAILLLTALSITLSFRIIEKKEY